MSQPETIFAIATGHGVAGVAVVRVSGPDSWTVVQSITRMGLPEPRRLSRRSLYQADGVMLDDGMIVLFEQGASFTGELSAEIHCHGSRAVQTALLAELARLPNCRNANPGEFTRRAFEAGLMDLSQIEGLGDLIHAETEFQRRQALRVMSGAASDQTTKWRASLVRARALIEVTIDWADEEVPEDVSPEVVTLISNVTEEMAQELAKFNRTERLREGFEVAIIGPPNVGKSTLINAIAGRTVAITSDIAGTTRDVIEVRCDLGGLPVTFLDTAGLRESQDQIERAGVEIALDRARGADLRLFLATGEAGGGTNLLRQQHDLEIWAKSDLGKGPGDIIVSAKTGGGVSALLDAVQDRLQAQADKVGVFGHRRQFDMIERCHETLINTKRLLGTVDAEVLAEHLRIALADIDSLAGRTAVEDVLGEVFSSFCLGK